MNKPLFIVFEGIDGSGKTTVSKMLQAYLNGRDIPTVWFREPGDSKWGRKIRQLANEKESIPIEEELQYFIEDRKIDVTQNILPSLEESKTVIVDRYYFSNACYQGARGMDIEEILTLNREFALEPDAVFIIDVDVETALQRIKKGRDIEAKLFEKKEFLQKVRQNYLSLKGQNNIHIIDGSPLPEEILYQQLIPLLPLPVK